MRYNIGEEVCISIDALIDGDAELDHVFIVTSHDGDETFYMLYNVYGEMCCLDGEKCTISRLVNGSTDIYDLVNYADGEVHFLLSEHDLDIAVFVKG